MEHLLRLLQQHGFGEVCANLHYLPEKIESYFKKHKLDGIDLSFHIEEQLSGDAGGVRACQSFLKNSTFIVLSGDLLTDADLSHIVSEHKSKGAIASIAIRPVQDVTRFGVAVLKENGFISGFQEKPKANEALSNLISTGIYVLEPEVFNYIPKTGEYGFGRQLFPELVKLGLPVLGVKIEDYWSDVGTIEQYRLSNFDALTGKVKVKLAGRKSGDSKYPLLLSTGARIEDNESVKGALMLGVNSVVEKGAKIKGTVVVGDNCLIASGAEVTDSVIWDNVQIGNKASVERSVIATGYVVAPNAKLADAAMVAQELAV
jgi:NDP-sugar pyrophosphorylase family protein